MNLAEALYKSLLFKKTGFQKLKYRVSMAAKRTECQRSSFTWGRI
jgi:hypothetical protein